MTIEGWVAVGPLGLVLGTFRQKEGEAKDAARRVLRLLGGPHLVAGYRLTKATLVVHDEAGPSGERAEAETN